MANFAIWNVEPNWPLICLQPKEIIDGEVNDKRGRELSQDDDEEDDEDEDIPGKKEWKSS